jgi:hypothetical protein
MLLLSLMTLSLVTAAQQVATTAGGTYENSNGSFAFTLGEPVILTLESDGIILTQGFHQNNIQVAITAVNDPVFSAIKVFPNPTADKLFIHLENTNQYGSTYLLHNFNGQQLSAGNITGMEAAIEFTSYVPGTYVLTILRDEKAMITYKLIKQ